MSGILNTKQRIMDTILTQEGKRQLANGELRLNFITFTDTATFYKKDIVSGSADATERIYFEACNLPQDQVTFEANDTGALAQFMGSNEFGYTVVNGKLVSGSTYVTTGIANAAHKLLDTSFVAFQRLQSIGTIDEFYPDNTFEISENRLEFDITDYSPFQQGMVQNNLPLDLADNFASDDRLSRAKNFMYLPPINKVSGYTSEQTDASTPIGTYPKLNSTTNQVNEGKILTKLDFVKKQGFSRTLNFLETSRNNNIFCQFFEAANDGIKKLDVIDFGIINDKKYFFIGNTFIDPLTGLPKFINLFTLIFEN